MPAAGLVFDLRAKLSVLAAQARLGNLPPRRRNRPRGGLVGKQPGSQPLFPRLPGEEGPAVIDQGRETDPAAGRFQERDAQATQLLDGLASIALGGGAFLVA